MTHVGFVVLTGVVWLERLGEAVSQGDVVSFIGIDKASVSLAVTGLLRKGLVARSFHPADGRAHRICADSSRALARQGIQDARHDNERFFEAIQERENELNSLLRNASANNPIPTDLQQARLPGPISRGRPRLP